MYCRNEGREKTMKELSNVTLKISNGIPVNSLEFYYL